MAGGLLNLVSEGQQNVLLNGNPSKTFFKTTYAKYTNFGLQKFRIDYEGSKTLQMTTESSFTFKVPRYADLLMDTYLSVTLPNIWSPILPPQEIVQPDGTTLVTDWAPYEFRWIQFIGQLMISKVSITCGNQLLQEFSGDYILNEYQRDFGGNKNLLMTVMSGGDLEMVDPANWSGRRGHYPNAYYTEDPAGPEPSIRGRQLFIPLNAWFQFKAQMAFPLISLQYNELHITVTFRPVNELFQIRDVYDVYNKYPYVAPNFNLFYMQFYRFLQPPPDVELGINSYVDLRTGWNADVHLISTYCFLSNDESYLFAKNEQKYLFKQVYEKVFYNVTGPNKVQLDSIGMVITWMFYFQRSDANLRNEWHNYTNWPYRTLPYPGVPAPTTGTYPIMGKYIGPGVNPDGTSTGLYISGNYTEANQQDILVSLGILFDGQYRENIQPAGVYQYIERFTKSLGFLDNNLYCYDFCLNTDPLDLQPSGAINMSRFNTIELEFTTIIPPLDPLAQSLTICDPDTGNIIGINKPTWRIYEYNYNLVVFEERYNMVNFVGGNCALMYAT
jgi:hypothetical protein